MSGERDMDNVVPFPAPARPEPAREPSVVTASLAEMTRRKEIARLLEPRFASKKSMEFSERVVMARNVRDYVYGLEAAGRLRARQVADRAFGREEVRAIQQYVLPQGVDTEADYLASHPDRPLARKPGKYREVMLAAADIVGDDRDAALLALAKGTRFWPGAEHAADDERRAANEIVELLGHIPGHLDRTYPLGAYFDLIERQQILPMERDGGIVCDGVEEFGWWEHEGMPSVRLATRWLEPHTVPVVVAVSEIPATDDGRRVDFDAVYGAGRSFEAWVSRRQIFSLGIGRIAGVVGPVAIFTHEIVLPDGQGYRVAERRHVDRFGPGWNGCTVDLGDGPLLAAWQLKEALDNPPDADEQEYDEPPDVRVNRITADWLLERTETGWHIPQITGVGVQMWRVRAQIGRGRIGAADTLPSIIERYLMAESDRGGPVTEITARYTSFAQALREWRALLDEKVQRRLGQVAARLAGWPDPGEDDLGHLG